MKKITAMTAALLLGCTPATAGNLADIGLDDPVVIGDVYQQHCRILFGLLPCSEDHELPSDDGNPDRLDTGRDDGDNPYCHDKKSNSGRGNGSEGDPDSDPGNSGGKNNGGD